MQALTAPLKELADFERILKFINAPAKKNDGAIALSGCVDSEKLHLIYGLSEGIRYKVIVTHNDIRAREILEEYQF